MELFTKIFCKKLHHSVWQVSKYSCHICSPAFRSHYLLTSCRRFKSADFLNLNPFLVEVANYIRKLLSFSIWLSCIKTSIFCWFIENNLPFEILQGNTIGFLYWISSGTRFPFLRSKKQFYNLDQPNIRLQIFRS